MDARGDITFSCGKNLSVTVPESFIGNASWFEKVSGFWRKKWKRRGVSQSSVKTLVSCYRKNFWELFGVSKKFWQQEICMDERRGYQDFRLILFCLTLPKTFFGFSSIFHKASGSENISWMLGGYHVLPSKISGITLAKTMGTPSVFQKPSGSKKFIWMGEGDITFFSRKFWMTVPENFIGKSSLFQKLSRLGRNIWTRRG